MKTLKSLAAGLALCLAQSGATAQPDTAKISANALFFADSLVKAEHFGRWDTYADLVPLSVIRHYGGKNGYLESIQKTRVNFMSSIEEDAPALKIQTLMNQDNQWQCIIRESRYIHRDARKLHIITYLLGQSTDEGITWRLFDVGYNKVANIIYMMPDVFGDLPIQEHTITSEEDEIAAAKAAQLEAARAAAKPVAKKTSRGK